MANNIQIPAANAAFTADGTAAGLVTVADNTPFYPGAIVNIRDNTGKSQECTITSLSGTTKIYVRFNNFSGAAGPPSGPSYAAGNDISGWTLANQSYIFQDSQLCRVEYVAVTKALVIP